MIQGDRMSGIVWLLFSLVAAMESYRLGIGDFHAPQAGFLPFAASLVLGILSFTLLLSAIRKNRPSDRASGDIAFNRPRLPKVFYVIGSLFLYSIFLNTLGFLLASMIFIGIMLRAIEPQRWYVVLIGAIGIPATAYVLFDVFLKVQLPKGFLGL